MPEDGKWVPKRGNPKVLLGRLQLLMSMGPMACHSNASRRTVQVCDLELDFGGFGRCGPFQPMHMYRQCGGECFYIRSGSVKSMLNSKEI